MHDGRQKDISHTQLSPSHLGTTDMTMFPIQHNFLFYK